MNIGDYKMSTGGFLKMEIDDLRRTLFRGCTRVKDTVSEIVDQYKNGEDECYISREEARHLFSAINDLSGNVSLFMCCSASGIDISDLSHLVGDDERIEYAEDDDE